MRDDVEQSLQKVVEEWRKTLRQMEITISEAKTSGLTEDEVVRLLQKTMANGIGDTFFQLKLAHALLIE